MKIRVSASGVLAWMDRRVPCVLGRGGVVIDKREGDGATPAGRFPLRRVLYRGDRLKPPATALPVAALGQNDGWCDDPADANYNRPVQLPYPASAERLWQEHHLYDVVVVLGHNDDPVVPGRGSAIFLHVAAADRPPTAGCVALALEDLLELLEACEPDAVLEVAPPGA